MNNTNKDNIVSMPEPLIRTQAVLADGNGSFTSCPELMTEAELVRFLRIPEVSQSSNYQNVIENLRKTRGLPRLRICNKVLYPKKAVLEWIEKETIVGR